MSNPKREPVGISDFKILRTQLTPKGEPMPYCDKSLLISDILNESTQVMLFTRPRRFGKTLNLSMLKYFFGTKEPLFDDLAIAQYPNIMENYRNYPVISMSFKSMALQTFKECKAQLKTIVAETYREFEYLKTSPFIQADDQEDLLPCFKIKFEDSAFPNALKNLVKALSKHHQSNVIVLLDEYDAPLQAAYVNNYLEEALDMLRPFLSEGLKDNTALFKGIVTGVSRISRENIFSGLNNFGAFDISENPYAAYFGFTESEVQAMVEPQHLKSVKEWYNGYVFGSNTVIFNPWSIINFLKFKQLKAYWINSSKNEIIKESLTADKMKDVQILIEKGYIEIPYDPHLVLEDLRTDDYAFWNLMYTSGYLTAEERDPNDIEVPDETKMHIPNKEVRKFFEKTVKNWFGNGKGARFLADFCDALLAGEDDSVQEMLQQVALHTIGEKDVTRRTQESFYHGLLLGITLQLKGRYRIESNREAGFGRHDIALFPHNKKHDPGVIIEIKTKKTAQAALDQIQEKRYDEALKAHGCQNIEIYGVAFRKKEVRVVKGGLANLPVEEEL